MNINQSVVFFLLMWVSFICPLKGSVSPVRPLSEMFEISRVVADGIISSVEKVGTEPWEVVNGKDVLIQKYRAVFKVQSILKNDLSNLNDELIILYQLVDDLRYRGERVSRLKVGDAFRLFAETIRENGSGEISVYIHGDSAIRPEVYGSKESTLAVAQAKSTLQSQMPLKESEPITPKPVVVQEKAPEVPEEKQEGFFLMSLLIGLVVGIVTARALKKE